MVKSACISLSAVTSAMLLAVLLSGCGGSSSSSSSSGASSATPPTATTLTLSGGSERAVAGGAAVALIATPSDTSTVTWTLGAGNPGSLSGSTGAGVNYLPPASITADTIITITATANGASKSYTLTLRPADYPRLEFLAGDDGGEGHMDGTGTAARLMSSAGASSDASGNLYLPDSDGVLRKVTPAGVVTTLLATTPGYVDGTKGTARIGRPGMPAAGPDGSLYFTDTYGLDSNQTVDVPIRKLAADGSISTIARITVGPLDRLSLTADSKQLYAYLTERISTVSFSGTVATLSGMVSGANGSQTGVDGSGATARFQSIQSVAADGKGNLYVNDAGQVVRKVAADGSTSTLAGAYANGPGAVALVDGPGAAARFNQLHNLALTSSGNIAAFDYYQSGPVMQYRLRTITPDGVVSSVASTVAGSLIAGANNTLYYQHAGQIDIIKPDGSLVPFVGKALQRDVGDVDGTGAAARFNFALRTMGADAAGNLYVADDPFVGIHLSPVGLRLRKVTPAGEVTTIPHTAEVSDLSGLAVDAAGNTYVSTYQSQFVAVPGSRIFKIAPDGTTTVLAGALPSTDWQDGVGANAHFIRLSLQGIDADGNLYGIDTDPSSGKMRYTRITPAGVVSTISALPVTLNVLADAAGNTYHIDSDRGAVLRTTTAGVVSLVAGTPGQTFTYGGDLPGYLALPSHLVKSGPYSFTLFSGHAIMRLYVPH